MLPKNAAAFEDLRTDQAFDDAVSPTAKSLLYGYLSSCQNFGYDAFLPVLR